MCGSASGSLHEAVAKMLLGCSYVKAAGWRLCFKKAHSLECWLKDLTPHCMDLAKAM